MCKEGNCGSQKHASSMEMPMSQSDLDLLGYNKPSGCNCGGNCECGKCYPFTPSDYSSKYGFPPQEDFTGKCYIYDSTLATNGELFNIQGPYPPKFPVVPYYPRNVNLEFNFKDCGVPGPYPYQWGWDRWGGDETYDYGKHFYHGIIGHFGHTHILNIQAKVAILSQKKDGNVSVQDAVLKHLLNGSTQMFNWYAGLVNLEGNPIPYDPSTPAGFAKYLFNVAIDGINTYRNDGIINPTQVTSALQDFKNKLAPNSVNMQAIIDTLGEYLDTTLRLNIPGVKPIDLMAWFQLLGMHQNDMFNSWVLYDQIYNGKLDKHQHEKLVEEVNKHINMAIEGGRQFGALFSTWYMFINFFDIYLSEVLNQKTEPAIPNQYRDVRTKWILDSGIRWWTEHVSMFEDFAKAAAKFDYESQYKTQINILESCACLGLQVGEVFRAFDKLLRYRNLYEVLPSNF
jgi:hypothetical protein